MTGETLQAGRERLGLTVEQFAAVLGVSPADLDALELGRRLVSGPVALAAQALFDGYRPPHLRALAGMRLAA